MNSSTSIILLLSDINIRSQGWLRQNVKLIDWLSFYHVTQYRLCAVGVNWAARAQCCSLEAHIRNEWKAPRALPARDSHITLNMRVCCRCAVMGEFPLKAWISCHEQCCCHYMWRTWWTTTVCIRCNSLELVSRNQNNRIVYSIIETKSHRPFIYLNYRN